MSSQVKGFNDSIICYECYQNVGKTPVIREKIMFCSETCFNHYKKIVEYFPKGNKIRYTISYDSLKNFVKNEEKRKEK